MDQSHLPLQQYQPASWQRLVQRLAALRPISWALSHVLSHLDRWEMRRTQGKHSLTTLFTGLPVITLHTIGARSGLPRSTFLVAIPDGENIVLIASYFGSRHHPGWYHNLIAHPHAQVSMDGHVKSFVARKASSEEYQACWSLAVSRYSGFEAYRRRAAGREIPVIVLEPLAAGFPEAALDHRENQG